MRIQVRNRGLLSLVLSLLLVLGMFATCVEPVHADNEDYDLSNFMVTFDEAYRFLDDIETTPYPDYFYIVTTGRVLEPFVEDTAGELLDSDYYTASYCECRFNEEKNEWEKIDENNWLTEFPTEPGVYFCKVEGVAPYYGSYEKLDLIRVQEPQKYEIPTDYKEIDLSDVYADGWYKSVESGEDMGVPCYSYKLPAERKQWVKFRVASSYILVDRPIMTTWVRLLDSEGYEVDSISYDTFVTYPAEPGETYYLYAESSNTQEDEYIMVADTTDVYYDTGVLGTWEYEKSASGVKNPVDGSDGWSKYTVGELDSTYVWKSSGENDTHWYYYWSCLNIISSVPVQYYNPRLESNFGSYQTIYKTSILSEEEEALTLADGEKNNKVNYTFNITDYSDTEKRESKCKVDVYIPAGYVLYVDDNGFLHVKKGDGGDPVDPTPVDPTPVDPQPTPEDPTPVEPQPAPVDPTPEDPTPVDPAPVNPQPAPIVTPTAPVVPAEIVDLPAVKMSKPAPAKKSVNVKWKKVSKKNLKKIQGIEIQIATDPGFTNIVKTATAGKKKISKTIKGLTSKQSYYVRIRAYKNAADGKHVSTWKMKKVKIK